MTQRTITLAVTQDALVAQLNGAGSGLGAGRDDHLPVGKYVATDTYVMRGLLGFEDLPAKLAAEGATRVVAARLKAKTNAQTHVSTGGSPRAYLRRITAAWTAGTAGAGETWSASNAVKWSNQPAITNTGEMDHTWPTAQNTVVAKDCVSLLRAVLPATVIDDLGAPGGGGTFYGIRLESFDETSQTRVFELYSLEGSYAPYLEIDIDDNAAPLAPATVTPAGGETHLSTTGQTLTITFDYSDPDGDAMAAYQYRVWPSAITDAMIAAGTAGTALYDSGSVAASSPPPGGATATGLTRRSSVRPQVRVKDAAGSWGPYTAIDTRLVALDAKPTPTNITITPGSKTPTWAVSISDPDSALGGTNGQMTAIEIDVWTNTGLGRVYLWQSGKQAVALTQRGTLAWGTGGTTGDDPQFGQSYGWHLRIWDDADQPSDFTADATWTPIVSTGPEIMLPADTSTKQDTQRPTFTIGSTTAPMDQIEIRIFADAARALLYWDSGVVSVGSTTVRALSAAAQAVLAVTSIANVTAGDTIRINHGGGTQEDKIVLSTNAVGPTITFTTNLANAHNSPEPVGTMQTARQYPATQPPAFPLAWGSAPWWDAARRPVGSVGLDPFSDTRQFRINSLPTKPSVSVVNAGSVVRPDGVIVTPNLNPLIRIPFTDPDVALYGELPTRKIFEIRAAATPKGSGALIVSRLSTTTPLPDEENVGETIDLLDAVAGWTAVPGAVAAVATNPAGYGGTSLQYSPGALVNPAVGFISKSISAALGARLLAAYSAGAIHRIWLRSTNITALQVQISFQKTGAGSWTANYAVTIPGAINTYAEASNVTRGSALTGSTGTPWSSAPDTIRIIVNPTAGTQTYVVLLRDWRIGVARTAVPAGDLAYESSYDVRGQWGDAAAPGSMGVASDWATIKPSQPPVATLVTPANAAVVTDPTPVLTWTKSSPGAKATTSQMARLYRRVAGQDEEIWRSGVLGAAVTVTPPAYLLATASTYAWEVDVIDSDGLLTTSSRFTFTTTFTKPTALATITLTPDPDKPRVAVSWPASTDPNLVEYVLRRRRGNGDFFRIDANGDKWVEGKSLPITAIAITDFAPGLNTSIDYQLQVSNGAVDTATGLSDPVEGSTLEALDGWWYQVPNQENFTLELHYVEDWQETKEIQELVREPLPDDSGQETVPIVQTGALQGAKVDLTMGVALEDADQLRVLRLASTATTFAHGYLMSPLGDVWAAKPRAISQRKGGGAGRRTLSVPFLQVK